MKCLICDKDVIGESSSVVICTPCRGRLSIKKYKRSDIMRFKSPDDTRFIANAITIEDLFT